MDWQGQVYPRGRMALQGKTSMATLGERDMQKNAIAALAMAGALALLANGRAAAQGAGEWKTQLLIIGSVEELHGWIDKPPAERGGDSGRLRSIPAGKKVFLPIVVSDLMPPEKGELRLTADIEFRGPDGKLIWDKKRCCTAVLRDRPDARTVSLGPAADVEMDASDPPGLYTVRVTVTDGKRSSTATEAFRLERGAAPLKLKPSGPVLNMGDAPRKPPSRDRDVRECLGLATPAEVIKCAERK
jgi:hypothetical protein